MICSWRVVCILCGNFVAIQNADEDARAVREYFTESVPYTREVYKVMPEDPEWLVTQSSNAGLPILDALAELKKL